jgi:uncharacterized protein (DUF1501 family)
LIPIGRSAWAAASTSTEIASRRLIVIFLRGAVDGLSVVVPYAEPGYRGARSTIALNAPGAEGGVIDLDGQFGLHPALSPLMPLWQAGKLAFVHAAGSPDATRSHFDAQDYMESATPGRKSTPDGWMNRLLGALPAEAAYRSSPARAVSIGPVLPRIYAGTQPIANLAAGKASAQPTVLDRPKIGGAFSALYAGDDKISQAYRQSRLAQREVTAALNAGSMGDRPQDGMHPGMHPDVQSPDNGAPLPFGFPDDASRLARLMRNDARVQLAFMALGGWDTHANQGAAAGPLAQRLQPLGHGLAALASGLGPVFDQTVVMVMSEFGRTVRQNGNGGTDHGHGNVMWLLGGGVAGGGKVQGRWPGLDANALHEGRDLAVTTDFRDVVATVCERHLKLPDARLTDVLPGFTGPMAGHPDLIRS